MESADCDEMPPLEDFTHQDEEEVDFGLTLKHGGLDLNDLKHEKDVQFKVDHDGNNDLIEEMNYLCNEDLLDNLNLDCTQSSGTPKDPDDSNLTPFELLAKRMTDISKDGGVRKEIVRNGTGPVVSQGAIVRVHYNSYLEYSDEPFDSSRLRGKQTKYRIGEGCIAGWDLSVSTMKKGEISRFLVEPHYAYGKLGVPPRIPANATVLYEIELIHFIDENAADHVTQRTEAERKSSTFEDIYKAADSLRQVGNDAFLQNQLRRALAKYGKASRIMEYANLRDEQDQQLMEEMVVKLNLNSSLCCLRLKQFKEAKRHASKVLEIEKDNVKARYRLGKTFSEMGEFKSAQHHLLLASKLAPGDEDIAREIDVLNGRILKHRNNEERMYKKMFSQPSDNP